MMPLISKRPFDTPFDTLISIDQRLVPEPLFGLFNAKVPIGDGISSYVSPKSLRGQLLAKSEHPEQILHHAGYCHTNLGRDYVDLRE